MHGACKHRETAVRCLWSVSPFFLFVGESRDRRKRKEKKSLIHSSSLAFTLGLPSPTTPTPTLQHPHPLSSLPHPPPTPPITIMTTTRSQSKSSSTAAAPSAGKRQSRRVADRRAKSAARSAPTSPHTTTDSNRTQRQRDEQGWIDAGGLRVHSRVERRTLTARRLSASVSLPHCSVPSGPPQTQPAAAAGVHVAAIDHPGARCDSIDSPHAPARRGGRRAAAAS